MNAKPDLTRWIFLAFALACLPALRWEPCLTLGARSEAIPVTPVIGITPVTAAGPASGCWTASMGAPASRARVTNIRRTS